MGGMKLEAYVALKMVGITSILTFVKYFASDILATRCAQYGGCHSDTSAVGARKPTGGLGKMFKHRKQK